MQLIGYLIANQGLFVTRFTKFPTIFKTFSSFLPDKNIDCMLWLNPPNSPDYFKTTPWIVYSTLHPTITPACTCHGHAMVPKRKPTNLVIIRDCSRVAKKRLRRAINISYNQFGISVLCRVDLQQKRSTSLEDLRNIIEIGKGFTHGVHRFRKDIY